MGGVACYYLVYNRKLDCERRPHHHSDVSNPPRFVGIMTWRASSAVQTQQRIARETFVEARQATVVVFSNITVVSTCTLLCPWLERWVA